MTKIKTVTLTMSGGWKMTNMDSRLMQHFDWVTTAWQLTMTGQKTNSGTHHFSWATAWPLMMTDWPDDLATRHLAGHFGGDVSTYCLSATVSYTDWYINPGIILRIKWFIFFKLCTITAHTMTLGLSCCRPISYDQGCKIPPKCIYKVLWLDARLKQCYL